MSSQHVTALETQLLHVKSVWLEGGLVFETRSFAYEELHPPATVRLMSTFVVWVKVKVQAS